MRKIYRRKHDKVKQVFSTDYPNITVSGDQTGMHVIFTVPHHKSADTLKQLAEDHHIAIYPITDYLIKPIHYEYPTFILGFGGIVLHDIERAIHKLMDSFGIEKETNIMH